MKKAFYFLSILILFTACNSGTEYTTFTDEVNGYQIDYPQDWDTTKWDLRMSFMAIAPVQDSLTDGFKEGVSISIFQNEGKTIRDIVDENVEMAKLYYSDAKIIETDFTDLNGTDCIQLELSFEAEELKLTNIATFFNHNGFLFTITQSSEQDKIEKYREMFEEILISFRFNG